MVKRLALDRQLDTVPEATKPGWSHRNLLAGTQLRVKQAVHSDPCDFSEQEGFLLGTRQPPPKNLAFRCVQFLHAFIQNG